MAHENISYISVDIDPASIPEPCTCPSCSEVMDVKMLEYKFPTTDNPLVKNDRLIPGYVCQPCGIDFFDSRVGLLLDKATVPALEGLGETTLAQSLRRRIEVLERTLI